MYKTYFVSTSSLVLPHGTFLKGQPVTLPEDPHTLELISMGLLNTAPTLKKREDPAPKAEEVIEVSTVAEDVREPVQSEIETSSEVQAEVEPPVEDSPPRKRRNGRRKRSTERPS